jgi:hypothetical protein
MCAGVGTTTDIVPSSAVIHRECIVNMFVKTVQRSGNQALSTRGAPAASAAGCASASPPTQERFDRYRTQDEEINTQDTDATDSMTIHFNVN